MTDKEKTLAFIEERIKWNEDMLQRDPKPSDIGRIEEAKCIRRFINSLQEEHVSEGLDEAASNYSEEHRIALMDYETGEIEMNKSLDILNAFKAGAKWQKKHLWKDAQGDDLPDIDREIIALLNSGQVVFAHRPYKGKYLGKNLTTGNIETFENETYDKGEWNQPNVKWWLDIEKLPNMEERV